MAKGTKKSVGGIIVRSLPKLKEILADYDFDRENCKFLYRPIPETDSFSKRYNRHVAGTEAGFGGYQCAGGGYRRIMIRGQNCAVHRLVWKIFTGSDPEGLIDHINGIRDDNRFENLRDVTPAENAINAVRGRWAQEKAARAEKRRLEREAVQENRERDHLARLKMKYEGGPSHE